MAMVFALRMDEMDVVGGTRGAVDNQYIENTYQIGQTGGEIYFPVCPI